MDSLAVASQEVETRAADCPAAGYREVGCREVANPEVANQEVAILAAASPSYRSTPRDCAGARCE